MGFTTYDDLINQLTTNGKSLQATVYKSPAQSPTVLSLTGVPFSLWPYGGIPSVGANGAAAPGGTVHTNEAGSVYFADQSPATKHLLTLSTTIIDGGINASTQSTLTIYDRLVSIGGISPYSVATTTISHGALPRYTTGRDVEAWVELVGNAGGTGQNPTVQLLSYTNESGVAGRSAPAMTFYGGVAAPIGSMLPLGLQGGDLGVRSIQSFRVTAIMGGSGGTYNLVLLRRLAMIPFSWNQINEIDLITQYPWMPRILDGASIGLIFQNSTNAINTFADLFALLRVGYGG